MGLGTDILANIQDQGHEPLKVRYSAIFNDYLLPSL